MIFSMIARGRIAAAIKSVACASPRIDYQGNERGRGYVRGFNAVPCQACGTSGKVAGRWCPNCGGYGDVPPMTTANEQPEAT